jgi:hypothetical protein
MVTEEDLYTRGTATMLASWEEYARGASGASVQRFRGAALAADARSRGCRTASLQSTPMAERVYAAVGCFLEYSP